ncbi:MAG: AAA family ATPase [Hyphomicrobiales bacterium]|nr:AAA family ATPase [Hyphomicrobiales bacterium]
MTLGHDDGGSADELRPVPRIAIQAFCDTTELAETLEAAGADRRMSRAHLKVQMGGLPAAVEFYGSAPTPNLVVVESKGKAADLLGHLDGLAEVCDSGTKVMVIGHVNDVVLYRELIRRGVSEYVVMPLDMFDLIRAIGDLYGGPTAAPLGRSVAFVGAKGGCGASTVAHNVAWSVGSLYATDVLIADFDLAWGTAGLDFNQEPAQGVLEALNSPERLDDVFFDRLLTKCSDNLSILGAPAMLDRTYDQQDHDFDAVVEVARSMVPLVVLDLPHQWNGWVKRQLCEADDVMIVATPELASLRNAKSLIDTLKASRPNDAPPHLIVSMSGMPKRPEIKPEEFGKALELPIAATIPFDAAAFGNAANKGLMIGEMDAKHPAAEVFRSLAALATKREGRKTRRSALDLGPLLAKLRLPKKAS